MVWYSSKELAESPHLNQTPPPSHMCERRSGAAPVSAVGAAAAAAPGAAWMVPAFYKQNVVVCRINIPKIYQKWSSVFGEDVVFV